MLPPHPQSLADFIENCKIRKAATSPQQSRRSKSNTPIPHHGTTKDFPAATWYSVRRTLVEMPGPTAGWGLPPFISAIVIHMSAFCFEVQRFHREQILKAEAIRAIKR